MFTSRNSWGWRHKRTYRARLHIHVYGVMFVCQQQRAHSPAQKVADDRSSNGCTTGACARMNPLRLAPHGMYKIGSLPLIVSSPPDSKFYRVEFRSLSLSLSLFLSSLKPLTQGAHWDIRVLPTSGHRGRVCDPSLSPSPSLGPGGGVAEEGVGGYMCGGLCVHLYCSPLASLYHPLPIPMLTKLKPSDHRYLSRSLYVSRSRP